MDAALENGLHLWLNPDALRLELHMRQCKTAGVCGFQHSKTEGLYVLQAAGNAVQDWPNECGRQAVDVMSSLLRPC